MTCNPTDTTATVQLPAVNTSVLSSAGAVAGITPFQISVTCNDTNDTPNSINDPLRVYATFNSSLNVDSATGNLIIDAGTQAATNVQVQILNEDSSVVNLADGGTTTQKSPLRYTILWTFYAQYYATGQATSGSVSTYATFTTVYS
ncbi:fimbrial protein [Serratia quinivorans]|uniref:fimbrial protein n=1 Tax=Serratia quinivorans TaxID=137545 RepID=UPI0021B84743|nr:fimbrial protein [Serratia quinivorans]